MFKYSSMSKKLCLCGRILNQRGRLLANFCTGPALRRNEKYNRTWRHDLPYSDVLFRYNLEVPIEGMLHLTTACNTYIKSRYNEDEPDKKELIVTIYAKGDQGANVAELQKVVDRVHKFRNIVRHKFTGHPPLLRVDFPYLQKYRDEIQNGMAIVVEMPYKYGTLAEIKGRGSLCIQDFENEYTSGYTDVGDIEVSKIRTVYADIFSGGDVFCNDHFYGSGQFICEQEGNVYMRSVQGVNIAMDAVDGDVETDSVYCSDVVYTNEQGNVYTGVVQATGCHVETVNGLIKVDSVDVDQFHGKIFNKGKIDVTVERATDFYIYHPKGGDVEVKAGRKVNMDLLIQSKTSSVSSEMDFTALEKYRDHIHKYTVTKGQLGDEKFPWKIENPFGHVRLEKGDWMRSFKDKFSRADYLFPSE